MPARGLSLVFAAVVAATVLIAAPSAAQRVAPGNVTVTEMKGSVIVSWRGVRDPSVSYRVLRGSDARNPGMDLTKPLPSDASSYTDGPPAPGNTVFYTVVAVYGDGSEGASSPVQFTAAAGTQSPPVATRRMPGATPLTMAPPLPLRATPVS